MCTAVIPKHSEVDVNMCCALCGSIDYSGSAFVLQSNQKEIHPSLGLSQIL